LNCEQIRLIFVISNQGYKNLQDIHSLKTNPMKTRSLLYTLLVTGGMLMASYVLYPTGSPGGKTGSPGDGFANCTECHSGNPQQASGWITSNIPAAGYMPGQTYTITATGTHTGVAKFGFEVTAEDASAAKKGTIIITDAVQTQTANSNKSITHTVDGTALSGDSKSWSFDWTAPSTGTGTVTFYGAFNAANGNGNNTGDVIYITSRSYLEFATGIGDDNDKLADINIFPNPFTDQLNIASGNLEEPVKSIRISGLDGKSVWSADIKNGNQGKHHIDASGFSKGIYFVSVIFSDNRLAAYKVVKN